MRYTTIIDVTAVQEIYRNINTRLVYLHAALKAGYHDNDRDQLPTSIRQLAAEVGISVSATRHALKALENAGLVKREGDHLRVTKWLAAPLPSPRPTQQEARKAAKAQVGSIGERYEREQQEFQRRVEAAIRTCTREQLEQWAAELEAGKRVKHCGIAISPTIDNAAWMREQIKALQI